MSLERGVREQITNPQLAKIQPIEDLKYPIGDIIPNWVFSFVSPLLLIASTYMKGGENEVTN